MRLVARGSFWLAFDDANQLLSISSDPTGANVLWSFVYDLNGNPTVRVKPDLSAWVNYTWDVQDRLVQVDDVVSGETWTHAYDPRNRRVAQTAPEKARDYTWASDNRVGEYEAGSQVARLTYGAGLDDAIHMDRAGAGVHLHADAQGTIVSASSPAGIELASYEHDAFGALRASSGSLENDLGFTGRVRDTSGLLYYRARFYDPEIGRFLNPDPIRFDGGINFYAYANNNPVTLTDLTGEVALNLLGAVIGGVTAYTATRLSDPDASTETLLRRTVAGAVGGALLNPLLGRAFVAAAGNMAGTLAAGGATGSSRMQRYRVAKRVRSTSI